MRLSRMHVPILHHAPAEATEASHKLLLRAGLAPYPVHLLSISNAPEVLEAAAALEGTLEAAGLPILYDDRDQSAGGKFVGADENRKLEPGT